MKLNIKFNIGFLSVSTNVDLSDKDREHWMGLLSNLKDYRVLTGALSEEYAGEVFSAIVRLRNEVLPKAEEMLSANSEIRKSYDKMRRATRDFLTSVRSIGKDNLSNNDLRLNQITPIGYQWTFVAALVSMRAVFRREIEENCLLFGVELPEEFAGGWKIPDDVAEDWAQEMAS